MTLAEHCKPMKKTRKRVLAACPAEVVPTNKTTLPVQCGSATEIDPEFVRVPGVTERVGIKRGLCYRKINDGTFKSVVLREEGNKQGIRLIYWPSVKTYLHRLMAEQETVKEAAVSHAADDGEGGCLK
jgi:hypothetical protein